MTREELFRAVGEVREDQLAEAEEIRRRRPLRRWMGLLAACLALTVITVSAADRLEEQIRWRSLIGSFQTAEHKETQPDSGGEADGSSCWTDGETRPASNSSINVEIGELMGPGDGALMLSMASCTAWLEPEEILAQDTAVFRGTVERLRYYRAEAEGQDFPFYYTAADVKVGSCIRGGLRAGETVSVVYLGAKGYMSTSVSGPLEKLDAGDEAIFMPVRTSQDTGRREGESFLCYADLGDFYLSEGMRFVFAETEDGLEFARDVYEEIAGAETLDEAEAYLRRSLEEDPS